jgi:hypothetical protein
MFGNPAFVTTMSLAQLGVTPEDEFRGVFHGNQVLGLSERLQKVLVIVSDGKFLELAMHIEVLCCIRR